MGPELLCGAVRLAETGDVGSSLISIGGPANVAADARSKSGVPPGLPTFG